MVLVHEFDVHPHITYKNSSGLWWDTYCIRVLVAMPTEFKSKSELPWEVGRRHPFHAERQKFASLLSLPEEGRFWHTGNEVGFYYYFEDADTAFEFINANQQYVTEVERPVNYELVNAVRAITASSAMDGAKTVVREKLFFNKFRYAVHLQWPTFPDEEMDEEIIEVMERSFDYDRETKHTTDDLRVRFKFPRGSKIYLRDVNDVILLKLTLNAKRIAKIERIVLENELQKNQSEMAQAA